MILTSTLDEMTATKEEEEDEDKEEEHKEEEELLTTNQQLSFPLHSLNNQNDESKMEINGTETPSARAENINKGHQNRDTILLEENKEIHQGNEGNLQRDNSFPPDANYQRAPAAANEDRSKESIINYLCAQEKDIYFKSQQIDDPELTLLEKKSIARTIWEDSHRKFLTRFGKYLKFEHLTFFESVQSNGSRDEEYEIQYLINELKKNFNKKEQIVKNRRYAAIKTMMTEDGGYFSEKEMMKREPHLYQQLVGQYLTEGEKRIRDRYDVKNTPFSKILLDNMDKERIDKLRKEQERQENEMSDNTSTNSQFSGLSSKTDSSEVTLSSTTQKFDDNDSGDLYPKIPASFLKRWGDFDSDDDYDNVGSNSNNKGECSSHIKNIDKKKKRKLKMKLKNQKQNFITAGEREMLRQEFVGIMHSKFLEGEDKDFDYSKVDDNSDLDDLKQLEQDDEDKYFNGEDDNENDNNMEDLEDERYFNDRVTKMDLDEENSEEDDLDIYMRHLSKQSSLKSNNNVIE